MAIHRHTLLTGQPAKHSPRHVRAVLASCLFHAVLLALIVTWVVFHREAPPHLVTGSAEALPTLTLSKMVITSSPLPTPPLVVEKKILPTPKPVTPVATAPIPVKTPPAPRPPEEGVPVLAAKTVPAKSAPPAAHTPSHPAVTHHLPTPKAEGHAAQPPSAVTSSYAPGANIFPHPPYPDEARYLRETGTVTVKVRFDAQGNVAQVDVIQSSGVSDLDRQTRSYIRQEWHSTPYAGQTLSVPVEYKLTQ